MDDDVQQEHGSAEGIMAVKGMGDVQEGLGSAGGLCGVQLYLGCEGGEGGDVQQGHDICFLD